MPKPIHVDIALAILLAVTLFYYVRYTGLDLSKHGDSSLVIRCLVVGYLVFLAVVTKMVEQLTKKLEQLNKKLEKRVEKLRKPMNKDLGDEKMGCDHLLPLYHTASTRGNLSAVKRRSRNCGSKDAFPCVVREEPDRPLAILVGGENAQAFLRRSLLGLMKLGYERDVMNMKREHRWEQWCKGSKEVRETETGSMKC